MLYSRRYLDLNYPFNFFLNGVCESVYDCKESMSVVCVFFTIIVDDNTQASPQIHINIFLTELYLFHSGIIVYEVSLL